MNSCISKNNETSSEFSESLVRIVGIAEHVSHALIYKILDPSTNRIICKSEIRSAEDTEDHNKRLVPEHGERETPRIVKSRKEPIIYSSDDHYSDPDAIVNNKDLIGRTFLLQPDTKGFVKRTTIVDLLDKHIHDTENRSEHRQFKVNVNNDEYAITMSKTSCRTTKSLLVSKQTTKTQSCGSTNVFPAAKIHFDLAIHPTWDPATT